jgi:DNA invertase Pin-like site-specific DNA recombinase
MLVRSQTLSTAVALYARVSTERQAQAQTVESQVAA